MSRRQEANSILLVVESNEEIRSGLKRLLEMSGYLVAAVANEQEAVEIAPREHPDLILMDANLPPPESLSAAHRLHQYAELHAVPLIVISVHQHAALSVVTNPELDDFTVGYITEMNCFNQVEDLISRLLAEHPTR